MVERLERLREQSRDIPMYGLAQLRAAKELMSEARRRNHIPMYLKGVYDVGRELTFAGRPDQGLEVLSISDRVLRSVADRVPEGFVDDFETKFFLAKGVAAIRKAENENCVMCTDGAGCVFPIRGAGVHRRREGAEMSVRFLNETLRRDPRHLTAAWLLNIAQMTLGDHPRGVPPRYRIRPERLSSEADFPRFENRSRDVRVDTLSLAGGVVADDLDGDDDIDLMVSSWAFDGQIRLFLNRGDGTFDDRTDRSGLVGITGGLNLNHADVDNDGDVDVLVMRGAWFRQYGDQPNSLLRNNGDGTFTDVAYLCGLAGEGLDAPTQAAAWGDYDNDGDLDLVVGNEERPLQLFDNDGHGRFTDVAAVRDLVHGGFTKSVAWGDVDNDGDLDLYASNYRSPNRMWENIESGRFVDVTESAGVAGPVDSFATWFWDFDNDGHLDLYCPTYTEDVALVAADFLDPELSADLGPRETDVLYRGDGSGRFTDVGREMNLVHHSQTMGCNRGDLNNDGYEEIYLGTGYPGFEGITPNVMYLNRAGRGFADVSIAGGFAHLQKGHAIAFADFDDDGHLDVFAELGGAYPGDAFQNALFTNPGFEANHVVVSLEGRRSNRSAIDARIEATFDDGGGPRTVHRRVNTGGSFGSQPLRQHIGVGDADRVDRLVIRWPASGTVQTFNDLPVGRRIHIVEGEDAPSLRD